MRKSGALVAGRPRQFCRCGTLVWDGAVPRFTETVICPACGRDNSRRAPPLWVLGYTWWRLRRHRAAYGLWVAIRDLGLLRLSHYRASKRAQVPDYQTPNYSVAPNIPVVLLDGRVVPTGPNWS